MMSARLDFLDKAGPESFNELSPAQTDSRLARRFTASVCLLARLKLHAGSQSNDEP